MTTESLSASITTRDGLLYRNGVMIDLPEADRLAVMHGHICAERFVKALEFQQALPEKITEWKQLTAWMAVAKEKEMKLRNQLAEAFFTKEANGAFAEGTQKTMRDGYKVKLVGKLTYKILEELEAATLEKAQLGVEGVGLVKRKPELSVGTYKKLPADKRAIVDEMILITPASCVLEIEEIPN